MPLAVRAFFFEAPEDARAHPGDEHDHGEAPALCVIPLAFTAAGCIAMFVFASDVYRLLAPVAAGVSP